MSVVRRVACIALPQIRVEIVRAHERTSNLGLSEPGEKPLAVVVPRLDGAVKTERDILGGTKLDCVSPMAQALGVRPGETVAAARAQCADLRIRVVTSEAVRFALARVAEGVLSFGPTVAYCDAEDVVWVEMGGCAHLQGGERAFAKALGARVRGLGHACRIAIAEGPRIASAVARFAPSPVSARKGPAQAGETFVVPEGKGAAAIRVLPLGALALDGDTSAWLFNLGLRSCGDLQKLPRRSLGARLGKRAADVIQLLDGEDRAPLAPWHPPEAPEERIELDWGIAGIEALAFVMKTLCDRLAVRLEGRVMAAARVEIILNLDRGLYEATGKAMPPVAAFEVSLPSPIARAGELLAVVRARLDRETLAAPVLAVTLRASELSHLSSRPRDMFAPEPRALRVLPALVSELTAELGEVSVGTFALGDTWVSGERTQLVPFNASYIAPRHSLVTAALEPSRLVLPSSVPRASLTAPKLLARIEAVEWWCRDPAPRDLVAAWVSLRGGSAMDEAGEANHPEVSKPHPSFAGVGALAWVELRERSSEAWVRGWID